MRRTPQYMLLRVHVGQCSFELLLIHLIWDTPVGRAVAHATYPPLSVHVVAIAYCRWGPSLIRLSLELKYGQEV